MRELDTESPVVWPAWCYTGEVSGDREAAGGPLPLPLRCGEASDLASPRGSESIINERLAAATTTSTATALDGGARGGASPQGASTTTATHLSAAATPRPPRGRKRAQNHNGVDSPQVKTERLTPDNNSTSSRSVTPSSSSGHPGTPPGAEAGPTTGSSSGSGGQAPPHHLKHMEQMMGRNYSDFMRSLAAKYNNSNPNEYSRNGYGSGLDPRYTGFKTASAPFVGLMGPLAAAGGPQPAQIPVAGGAASVLSAKEAKEAKQPAESSAAASSLFGSPGNLFPPMLDMSSTQALLHMVRTANAAQNAAELENYLKGANKRETVLTSPLDLSSPSGYAPRKRPRRPGSVSPKPSKLAALGITSPIPCSPTTAAAGPPTPAHTPSPVQLTSPAATTTTATTSAVPGTSTAAATAAAVAAASPPPVRCPSLCGHMPCGDGQAVNRWTVEDVVTYVSSIDICAEYAQNFREHRIDGASLPLLSEDHLTGPIGMKLGPALKLRVLLARKLGACTVCLHCAHCHQSAAAGLSAAAAVAAAAAAHAQQQQQQTPSRRASASAN